MNPPLIPPSLVFDTIARQVGGRQKGVAVTSSLPAIPVVDVRDGGPLRQAREGHVRARALRDDCLGWFPAPARPLVRVGDFVARRWLERSQSPYVDEVRAIAAALGFPGIWFLNGSYQWSCTSCAREQDGVPWLARTLDWPFPGLGRHMEIARMQGQVGEFFNVTWPGYVGVLTASAPGRFAACINQAPLRRRTHVTALRFYDLIANGIGTLIHSRAIPPDQLLRRVFETCAGYAEARRMLEVTPIARPVIYTLAGIRPGERCVIERTENGYATREHDTGAANDWNQPSPEWEGRLGASKILFSTFDEAAQNSRGRRDALAAFPGEFAQADFAWVAPPVLNPATRLAVEMCPARGTLRVVGYEVRSGNEMPVPATLVREVTAERLAA